MSSLVLGADLSYTRSGLVVLDGNHQVIQSDAHTFSPGPHRLARAFEWLTHYMPKCNLCIIEDYAYGAPSRMVVVKLAELAAVFKVVLERAGVDYLVVSPSAIKKHVTGKGNSEKHIVARELERLFQIKYNLDPGFDLSDAAACAVWGVAHLAQMKGISK